MKKPKLDKIEQAIELIREAGIGRALHLRAQGIHQQYLKMARERGVIVRIAPGLYALPGSLRTLPKDTESKFHLKSPPFPANRVAEFDRMAEGCAKVKGGVICLLSALCFHQIMGKVPSEIWMAIAASAKRPLIFELPLHFVRYPADMLAKGVETYHLNRKTIQVHCPAKAVADCFTYSGTVGHETAVQALRQCWSQRKASVTDLWYWCRTCKVEHLMGPYLRSMI